MSCVLIYVVTFTDADYHSSFVTCSSIVKRNEMGISTIISFRPVSSKLVRAEATKSTVGNVADLRILLCSCRAGGLARD